jgi:PAS domain S-box-containing protein
MENLLSGISSGFVGIDQARLDSAIREALSRLGSFAGADQVYLVRFDRERKWAERTHDWHAPGGSPASFPDRIPIDPPSRWLKRLLALETLQIADTDPFPHEAAGERSLLQAFGANSALVAPLAYGKTMLGFLGMHASGRTADWAEEHRVLMKVAAGIVANAIQAIEAEARLRESEALFRSVWDRSADGMRLTDGEGTVVAVNEAFCALVQMARADLVGRSFAAAYEPSAAPTAVSDYRQQFSSGGIPRRHESRFRLWNGSDIDLEVTNSLIDIGQDRPLLLTLFRDISERKRADRRIAAFSTLGLRLSAATTVREAAEIIVDVADQVIGWDACLVNRYSAQDGKITHVVGMDLIDGQRTECGSEETNVPPSPLALRAIREGGQLLIREPAASLEGETMPYGNTRRRSASILYVPIRNRSRVLGLLSIQSYTPKAYDQRSLDTLQSLADYCGGALDRIQAEEALHSAQDQLRQSQKLEAIGQLAGGVAHDFNNLLTVIRGNVELFLFAQDRDPAVSQDFLQQILAASDRASNLTRQLLAFSRKQVMQTRLLDLNSVVGDLAKMLRRIIGEDIELQCNYATQLPLVQADPGMLEQVIMNLVVNARDAMPRGGLLSITTRRTLLDTALVAEHPEGREGEFVELLVSDTGSGISASHLPHIFEPFFTTKEVGKGTGLGLATVYGVVKQHEGWVEVSSTPGNGATFSVFLPARADTSATGRAENKPEPMPRGTETILLVEDDRAVRLLTRRLLENHGYKIYEAASGVEALESWRLHGPEIHLLLTDVVMPEGMSGRDLCQAIRQERPGLKVIFMSGYSGDLLGHDTGFLRRENAVFIQKPCPARELLLRLRASLDEK